MKKAVSFLILMMLGVGLGGCGKVEKETTGGGKNSGGVVVVSGEIKAKTGDEFVMSSNGEMVNITSKKVNLDQYLLKKVEVEGMFSGSTLYVDKIKERL